MVPDTDLREWTLETGGGGYFREKNKKKKAGLTQPGYAIATIQYDYSIDARKGQETARLYASLRLD